MRLDGISPLTIEGIYTMLLLFWLVIGTVGMISVGNWIDAKLEAFYERRERRKALHDALNEKVIEFEPEEESVSYDPKCLELVELFLDDEPELKADLSFAESLAQEIQTCIEDSILLRKSELREALNDRRRA